MNEYGGSNNRKRAVKNRVDQIKTVWSLLEQFGATRREKSKINGAVWMR
jgi:hypothetical protein